MNGSKLLILRMRCTENNIVSVKGTEQLHRIYSMRKKTIREMVSNISSNRFY